MNLAPSANLHHTKCLQIFILCFSVAACARQPEADSATIPAIAVAAEAHRIQLPDLPTTGTSVRSFDFVASDDRTLHGVVTIYTTPPGYPKANYTYYLRGVQDDGTWRWASPTLLTSNLAGNCRILLTPGVLHIIAGSRLRHFSSLDDGKTWKDRETLVAEDSGWASLFDVTPIGSRLVFVYMGWVAPGRFTPNVTAPSTYLRSITLWPDGRTEQSTIREFPVAAESGPGPRIIQDGKSLLVVAGLLAPSSEWGIPEQSGRPLRMLLQLSSYESRDSGATWGPSGNLPLRDEISLGNGESAAHVSLDAPDLAVIADQGRQLVLWGAGELYSQVRKDAGSWGPQSVVYGTRVKAPDLIAGRKSTQAIRTKDGIVVAWLGDRATELSHTSDVDDSDFARVHMTLLGDSATWTTPRLINEPRRGPIHSLRLAILGAGDSILVFQHGRFATASNTYDPESALSFYCIPRQELRVHATGNSPMRRGGVE